MEMSEIIMEEQDSQRKIDWVVAKDKLEWRKKYGDRKYSPELVRQHQLNMGIKKPKKNPVWNKLYWVS